MNAMAIFVAAFAAFCAGGVWYSPALLGRAWQRAVGISKEDLQSRPMPVILGVTFGLTLLMSWVLARLLPEAASWPVALRESVLAGGGVAFPGLAIAYLFAMKPVRLLLIDGGYCILAVVVSGSIVALWR